jgi:hypothetical protein
VWCVTIGAFIRFQGDRPTRAPYIAHTLSLLLMQIEPKIASKSGQTFILRPIQLQSHKFPSSIHHFPVRVRPNDDDDGIALPG